ncbi:MarR family winged helix-turn-helix transcriptional regulator [Microbacterium invictum]|uniref:DNA-binding MarR family transcriptional regulator n=1 Tax=Microbacterium invictum TaxID=515415 RepID=A0AA40SLE9_9MICO|nr:MULTISPECIES: MarR family transcriptional regulator [Microbacterium]MBB4138337.1 DNA-binding MarR family transcriptional regulator [Microbacterium invictum]
MTANDTREARADAVRALEGEFSELFTHVRRLFAENANRLSPGMLPGAYKVFTTIVRRESITLSALAESLHTDKGQLSRTVRELEDLGLVTRTPDPTDGRSSLISATADGLRRLREVRAPRESALSNALDRWDVDDIRELTRLLRALSQSAVPG